MTRSPSEARPPWFTRVPEGQLFVDGRSEVDALVAVVHDQLVVVEL
jgi:hypothetical protein